MKRTFHPDEFAFEQSDLETPAAFLATLDRVDPARVNRSGYAAKLFQAVTNQNSFDADAWIDLCMDVCSKEQLQTFANALGKWHQDNGVKQLFLPDILADAYTHSKASQGWVHAIVDDAGIAPGAEPGKRAAHEHLVQVSHTGPSMG